MYFVTTTVKMNGQIKEATIAFSSALCNYKNSNARYQFDMLDPQSIKDKLNNAGANCESVEISVTCDFSDDVLDLKCA